MLRLGKELVGGREARKKCVLIFSPLMSQIQMLVRTYGVKRQCVECKVRCKAKCVDCSDMFMRLGDYFKKSHRMI